MAELMTIAQDDAVRLMSKGVAALAAIEQLSADVATYTAAKEALDTTYAQGIALENTRLALRTCAAVTRLISALEDIDASAESDDDEDD